MTDLNLNCDLGEDYSIYQVADEAAIMPLIDQANIACGFHAGDPKVIYASLNKAKQHGVTIGAHPSYPDRQGFGRRTMLIEPEEMFTHLLYQISALMGMAKSLDTAVSYVKPHGALYNDLLNNTALRHAVFRAVQQLGRGEIALMLLATPDYQQLQKEAALYQLPLWFEAFADRRYDSTGLLVPRSHANAILSAKEALAQTCAFNRQEAVFPVDSICVHGDTPDALALIRAIRNALK